MKCCIVLIMVSNVPRVFGHNVTMSDFEQDQNTSYIIARYKTIPAHTAPSREVVTIFEPCDHIGDPDTVYFSSTYSIQCCNASVVKQFAGGIGDSWLACAPQL